MAASGSDALLQKTDDELRYLVQNPTFYHPSLVEAAQRELRRRGISLSTPAAGPVVPFVEYEEEAPSPARRWLPAAAVALLLAGAGWWMLTPAKPQPTAAEKAAAAAPIVLESVKSTPLPTFETETATQVRAMRQQLPAPDRADTTATGRYLRMARRYWLAENQSTYLITQARADSAALSTFPGQVDLTLERISWFLRANAYNQSLTPTMEERLRLMQQGLLLRRGTLQEMKRRHELEEKLVDADLMKDIDKAQGFNDELRGIHKAQKAIRGNISDL